MKTRYTVALSIVTGVPLTLLPTGPCGNDDSRSSGEDVYGSC